jgi:chromosome segregation ATPase
MREIVFIALLICSTSSLAADIDSLKTERTTLREAMSALETEFNANEIEGERTSKRISDLEWSATQVEKQIIDLRVTSDALDAELANHAAVSQTLDVKLANHESSVQSHNSQCGGTFDDQNYIDWCNNSAASLNSERAGLDWEVNSFNSEDTKLNGEIEYYNQLAISIQEMIDKQATQEAIVDLEFEQHKAHRQELVDAGNRIQARLDEIQPYIDSCEAAIASGSNETMKAECGSMFDGNQ